MHPIQLATNVDKCYHHHEKSVFELDQWRGTGQELGKALHDLLPVSYTHLDVYKRQDI